MRVSLPPNLPNWGGARFASSESPEFRGVRVSVSPKIVIFIKNALKIPLKFSACGGLGGAGFGFLKFHKLGGCAFWLSSPENNFEGGARFEGGAFNANSLVGELLLVLLADEFVG